VKLRVRRTRRKGGCRGREGCCTGAEHKKHAGCVFRFQQVGTGGAVPNTKNTPHGPVFRVWQVEEGRGGEEKGDMWACLASPVDGGGWREGHASHRTRKTRTCSRFSCSEHAKHKKHAPCGVFFVFSRWEREGEIGGGVG